MSTPGAEFSAEQGPKAQPGVCPTCGVIRPGECRNDRGDKTWPPHWQRPSRPGIHHDAAATCDGQGPHDGRPELVGSRVLCPACAEES